MKLKNMNIQFTSHALERCLERTGMTGVEFLNYLNYNLKRKHLDYENPTRIRFKGFILVLKQNLIITIYNRN